MLDDRAAGLSLERVGGEQRALKIEQIIERKLLAALLLERGDPIMAALDVKSAPLTRILAVAK